MVGLAVSGCRTRHPPLSHGTGDASRLVRLVGFGTLDPQVLESLRGPIAAEFGGTVEVESQAVPIPGGSYDARRAQYRAEPFLTAVGEQFASAGGKTVGVTDVDLFVPELNFVFGQAELAGTTAVMSIHRLRPEFYGAAADQQQFTARAVTEAVHELGHTFGLQHCKNPGCVMFFSNSILDTDRKGWHLCQQCRSRLPRAGETG